MNIRRYAIPLLCAAAVAYACVPRPNAQEPSTVAQPAPAESAKVRAETLAYMPPSGMPPIASSLDVSVKDKVEMALRITNTSGKKLELDFASGLTHDFAILDENGREVWRWSADRMFTQALRNKMLDANETVTYEERWSPEGRRGTFTAVAMLRSTNHPVETRVSFTLP